MSEAKICAGCGVEFPRRFRESRGEHAARLYCSQECATLHRGGVLWSGEMEERLRGLFLEGLSASQIAIEFGMSRGAIAGKLDRMNLKRAGRINRKSPTPKSASKAARCGGLVAVNAVRRKERQAKEPGLAALPPPTVGGPVPLDVSLADARHDQCRFMAGNDFLMCGHKVAKPATPWCEFHRGIVYRPERKDEAA